MLQAFKDYIDRQHLFSPEQTVLLAVSGGRDSVAMADLMHRAGFRFAIAHCNFNLRPGDCDRDQAFVRQLAEDCGAVFHTVAFDTAAHAAEHGQSIEEAARQLRYNWFAGLCAEHGYHCLATAHHADDSIETFFLNLFRGTGIAGLHGIRPLSTLHSPLSTLHVVRPMLCFSRADIDRYVAERGLRWVEDHTNAELDARRNRIRLRLMPLLRELYPSVDATMLANISRLADTEALYREHIGLLRSSLLRPYHSALPTVAVPIIGIGMAELNAHPAPATILYELLQPYGFNGATVTDMLRSDAGGRLFRSATHVAELHRGMLLVAPDAEPCPPRFSVTLLPEGEVPAQETLRSLPPTTLAADASVLHQPLTMRPWRDGDRFRPFGMKGTRLVSDFLKDSGLSLIERRHVWLLADSNDRPLWIAGLRADERCRIGAATRQVAMVKLV